ncbi:unnamed protein product [Rhodiola kirilowii]
MGVEVGGFEVADAPAGAGSIPVLQENGLVDAGVNGSIKFGSHGDEPAKVAASKVSDGHKDAVDEWPAPRQVHSFYFIRYRPYDDIKLKAKKELIEKEVEKKTQARFQITEKIRAKKTDRAEIIAQLKALGAEDKQYWAIIDEKRKEMAPLQQALGQLRTPNGGRGGDKGGGLCSSEEELNDVIRSFNYRMQHESIPLSEEKQILKEIKALEQTRPQVVANAAKRAEIQGSMGQKETIQGQVKLIGGDLDGVRKEKQFIREKIKELEKQLNDLNQEINKLEDERQTVSDTRDKAYETRQQLNKQRNDVNAHFYENRSLINTARELAAKRDVKALEELANIEVEKFMAQWNIEKPFREDYEKRILSSLDNRFLSRDGRMRNPEEKPLVAMEAPTPAATESAAKAGMKKAKEDVKETPAPGSQKAKEETKPKGEGKTKPAGAEVSKEPAVPKDEDEVYIPPMVVSKAIEVDPEKLKEQKRQEEIAKAKQSAERKKKLAEKAAAKAAIKAQKEAEKKLKEIIIIEKEKKAKKKSGANFTDNAESEEPTELTEQSAPADQVEEKAVEEAAPASTKTRQPKNVVRQKIRSKATAPLPKAILKRKKATNYWQYAAPAGAIVVVLLLALGRVVRAIGNTNHINLKLFSYGGIGLRPISVSFLGSSGMCNLAQAVKGDVDVLLQGLGDKSSSEDVKRILEMARRASSRREVLHTDFLTPPVAKESMQIIEKLADVKAVAQGGYPQAERCRISVGHPEALTSDPDVVAALSITGNFGFQPCSHGDFLGAILGTGIAREKLGDIILPGNGEKGAQILIVPELVDFIITSLDKVGNVPVSCKKLPLLALEYEPARTKSFKAVEASLRVDAVASAGFKISRTKLGNLISSGDVRVNWSTVTKNGFPLKTGDIVSVSGLGRIQIGEINETRKGKFAIEIIKFI